jgi:predicted ferric reductase
MERATRHRMAAHPFSISTPTAGSHKNFGI